MTNSVGLPCFYMLIIYSYCLFRCLRRWRSSCTLCCTVGTEVKQWSPNPCCPGWPLSTPAPLTSQRPSWPWSEAFWETCRFSCRRASSSRPPLKQSHRLSPTPSRLLGCQRRYYRCCFMRYYLKNVRRKKNTHTKQMH